MENKETTDNIPTAENILTKSRLIYVSEKEFTGIKKDVIEAMQEYATILLRKQAEVIAEYVELNGAYISKQSIITASEQFIKYIK